MKVQAFHKQPGNAPNGGVSFGFPHMGNAINILMQGLCVIFLAGSIQAQDAVVWEAPLGPNAAVRSLDPDQALANGPDFHASAFTNEGDTNIYRCMMGIDLSGLNSEWIIERAYLSLYGNPTSIRPDNQGFNDCWLERIVEPWDHSTVNWNNQPATTPLHRVALPQSWIPDEDLLEVDVTALMQDMQDNPGSSYGLMMRLQQEDIFRSRVFASSSHPDAALRPRLVVEYRNAADTGGSTGIGLQALALDWQVGPNPCVDALQLQADLPFSGQWRIAAFDASGRLVFQQEAWAPAGEYRAQLDLSQWPSGSMYLIRLEAKDPNADRIAVAQRRIMRLGQP